MSHFAQINSENIVERVLVIEQDVIDTGHFGDPSTWIQTSYNTKGGVHYNPETGEPSDTQSKALRKNYAGIGFTYDVERDAFIPPKPFDSWILNEDTCLWNAPVSYPDDGNAYYWDEPTLSWILIEQQPDNL